MSTEAMTDCWGPGFPTESTFDVSPSTVRLVALAVADVVNDLHGNEFYGSISKLAAKVGLSRDTVGLVMKHLVATKVVTIIEQRPGTTTRYRWNGASDARPAGTVRRPPAGTLRHHLPEQSGAIPNETQAEPKGSANPADPQAPGEPPKKPKTKPKVLSPNRVKAETIVTEWWDEQPVKPASTFMGVVKLVERLLIGDWSEVDVKRALRESPTTTGPAFDMWRKQPRKASLAQQRADGEVRDRDEVEAAVATGNFKLAWKMVVDKGELREGTWFKRVCDLMRRDLDDASIAVGVTDRHRTVSIAEVATIRGLRDELARQCEQNVSDGLPQSGGPRAIGAKQ